MKRSPKHNQQSKSEVEEICIYQNMESGCHDTASLSENKWWVPCQTESQATISESSHVQ